jgi:AcrR family transcriptional regulator
MDPRVVRTRQAVFHAAHGLLAEGGPDAVTHSAVAERSGVGRATLYRHWPRRQDLIGDIVRQEAPPPPAPWAGELRADLTTALTHAANVLASPAEATRLITLADRAQRDADARQLAAMVRERHPVRAALELAHQNGQLARDVSIEEAQALLLGPILYQRLWATRPIDAGFIDRVVGAFVTAQECR